MWGIQAQPRTKKVLQKSFKLVNIQTYTNLYKQPKEIHRLQKGVGSNTSNSSKYFNLVYTFPFTYKKQEDENSAKN